MNIYYHFLEDQEKVERVVNERISKNNFLENFRLINSFKNSHYALKDIISKYFRFPASSYFRKPLRQFIIKKFFLV